jgi:hypothetical protein
MTEVLSAEPQRTCPSCGNELSGAMEFCPVCMLSQGLAGGVESGESSFEDTVKPTPEEAMQRFEHYELVTGEDRQPVELGRGAMGVTYKAVDIDLHCPVTLKVISEKFLGDESVRLRFLREARAAASVRHPNVASVFHLGRTGQNYFYAMEFVEGETLENLIKRSGRLEETLGEDSTARNPDCRQHQRPGCSLRVIGMLWTGRSCRRRQCWLWRKRKRATGLASAPKLRQNRIKCSSLRFKYNSLLYLNRGLPGRAVYDLSAVRQVVPACPDACAPL